jgi:carbon storage regulator CsrA
MQIINITTEQTFYIKKGQELIKIVLFNTPDEKIIKFGIDASKDIKVHREEIYESIQNQKKSTNCTSG